MSDPLSESDGYLQAGRSLWLQGQYESALPFLTQARELAQAHGLSQIEVDTITDMGIVATYHLSQYDKARHLFQTVLKWCQQNGDKSGSSNALNNLGVCAWYEGKLAEAKRYYERAGEGFREIGNHTQEAMAFGNIGLIDLVLNNDESAMRFFQQALQRYRLMGIRRGEAWALNSQADIFNRQGRLIQALTWQEKALTISRSMNNQRMESNILRNKALTYGYLGQYRKGREIAQQALAIRQTVNEPRAKGLIFMALSRLHMGMGDNQQGQKWAKEALQIAHSLENVHLLIEALVTMGEAWLTYDLNQASQAYESAIQMEEQAERPLPIILAKVGLGEIALQQGNIMAAQAVYPAVQTYLQTYPHLYTNEQLHLLYFCYQLGQTTHQPDIVQQAQKQATTILQTCAARIPDETMCHTYLHQVPINQQWLHLGVMVKGMPGDE